jgi:hypothetical protein
MRTLPRYALALLVAAATLTLLACGGKDDVDNYLHMLATQTAVASRQPAPTATAAATPTAAKGASGGIARATAVPGVTPAGASTGAISGALSYPSEGIPAQRVVAFAVGTDAWYAVETAGGDREYLLSDLPAGTYHVVAYVIEPGLPGLSAGYSQFILCGAEFGCDDHSLVDVVVTAGRTVSGIDTGDWYAPDGAFPPDPTQ